MAIDGIGNTPKVQSVISLYSTPAATQPQPAAKTDPFGPAVEISLSDEAKAFLDAAGSGQPRTNGSLSDILEGAIADVEEAFGLALENEPDLKEQTRILDAGAAFAGEVESLIDDFEGQPLTEDTRDAFLQRLGEAEDAFFEELDDPYFGALTESQEETLDTSLDLLSRLFDAFNTRLGGTPMTQQEDALISAADGKFYDLLDEAMSGEREITDQDRKALSASLVDLQSAMNTVLTGRQG